jgi:2-aminobenzoate-CoA ligase
MLGPSAHIDTFTRDNLPPPEQWPDFLLRGFDYPQYLNAAVELTDRMVERGFGDKTALIGNGRLRTYKELSDWTNRLARALVEDLGRGAREPRADPLRQQPGHGRVLARRNESGAVVVNTSPLQRTADLGGMIEKAQITFALCDTRHMDELVAAAKGSRFLKGVVGFDGTANFDAELDRMALTKPVRFDAVQTGRDDVALIAFSCGGTGAPKAALHFHRDLLAVADGYAREVLATTPDDVVVGTPSLAFTYGLGSLAVFPLRYGAASVLLEGPSAAELVAAIQAHKATICCTSPPTYRAVLKALRSPADVASLRVAVSAGEALPAATFAAWTEATGVPILDGVGGTEMLHVFLSNRIGAAAPGISRPAGWRLRGPIVDEDMREKARGETGRLAVRGPTGCRYLADPRQREAVRDGWNILDDAFRQDADGAFHFVARTSDLIISSGQEIAAPEVEAALLSHPLVAECAAIGIPDRERGEIVKAFVVLAPGTTGNAACVKRLQEHVEAALVPAASPRSIRFVDSLPRTVTGKIKRFQLRQQAP